MSSPWPCVVCSVWSGYRPWASHTVWAGTRWAADYTVAPEPSSVWHPSSDHASTEPTARPYFPNMISINTYIPFIWMCFIWDLTFIKVWTKTAPKLESQSNVCIVLICRSLTQSAFCSSFSSFPASSTVSPSILRRFCPIRVRQNTSRTLWNLTAVTTTHHLGSVYVIFHSNIKIKKIQWKDYFSIYALCHYFQLPLFSLKCFRMFSCIRTVELYRHCSNAYYYFPQ